MPEFIIINGAPVEVPIEVETAVGDSRAATEAWLRQQLIDRGVPHVVFHGAPVPVPEDVAADKASVAKWAKTEAIRRGLCDDDHETIPFKLVDGIIAEQVDAIVTVMKTPKPDVDEASATVPAAAPAEPAASKGITDITSAARDIPVAAIAHDAE